MSGIRGEEKLDEYTDLGDCTIMELTGKQALVKIGERHQVWIPYSIMHEEDMPKISVDVELGKLRVQTWFFRKKRLDE